MRENQPDQRMNTWQGVIGRWKKEVVPPEQITPKQQFARSLEEVEELRIELDKHDGSSESSFRVGLEAVDVMITVMGVIDSLGLDTERLMEYKLDQIHRKYNPITNKQLRNEGMGWDQALKHQKSIFEKEQ